MHHDLHSENSVFVPAAAFSKCHEGPPPVGRACQKDEGKSVGGLGLGDNRFCPDEHSRKNHRHSTSGGEPEKPWSYLKWCACLVPLVLRSRTPLASFLSRSISLSKSRSMSATLASTFFPVPIPFFGVFGRMSSSSSASRRHSCHISRAVHVIVMTLNFWHCGGRWCDPELLLRKPSRQHQSLYRRIRLLIRSDWPAEVSSLPKAGRRFPQLVARLSELSDCLTRLGPSSNPYDKSFNGSPVPSDNTRFPELSPYRDLDPGRLRIKGSGEWDATPFLDDMLCMIYREPAVIRFSDQPTVVPCIRDSPETIGELAKVWDSKGLLYLHREPFGISAHVRIFNTLKSETQDRQIGDRRAMNSQESRVRGPSSDLPAGCDLTSLLVNPLTESVVVSITDRSDFYHQFASSPSRAVSNTLGPSVPIALVSKTKAYESFLARASSRRVRERVGDHLEDFRPSSILVPPEQGHIFVAFNSVLQGDHAGVEIATESHSNLLRSQALLDSSCRLVASSPLMSFQEAQGLVIDDFFAVSIQEKSLCPSLTKSAIAYQKAQEAYNKNALEGSPEKDLIAQPEGRVIGAYLNGGHRATSRGLCTVAAPIEKRLGLSVLSLQVSQLTHTTDALHLCLLGGWSSILGYRRPLMSVLQESYHLVDMGSFDANHPSLVRLPRTVATELVTLSVLMPLAVSDIAVPLSEKVYCTDASLAKGAILETTLDEKVMKVLYRTTISKGAYSRMLSFPTSLLKSHDWSYEEEGECSPQGCEAAGPERPLAFSFEFIEVFAGSAKVTKFLSEKGIICGPPLDLSLSPEFDLSLVHVISWLTYLVASKRLRGYMLEPPCTTYSIMRRPRLRSRTKPLGFVPTEEKTLQGNVLSCRSGQLMHVGVRHGACGLLETPFSSYMKHMPFWRSLEKYDPFSTVRCDSCRYGSPHLKSFRFLCLRLETDLISRRCQCTGKHLPVEGSLTKASAVYTDELAESLAETFAKALFGMREPEDDGSKPVGGLESLLINDVMETSEWQQTACWTFKKQSHINILEESAVLRLASIVAREGRPVRLVVITDSNVVKCATAKGRTSSRGLGPILRRLCALTTAAGIYLNIGYIPTRLNAADDPTRDHPIRKPIAGFDLVRWTSEDLFKLSSLGRFRRWTSNWVRLCILLLGPNFISIGDRSSFRSPWPAKLKRSLAHDSSENHSSMDFDSTLGFPGEGPFLPGSFFVGFLCHFGLCCVLRFPLSFRCLLTWTSFCFACWWWVVAAACLRCFRCLLGRPLVLVLFLPCVSAMPIFPSTPGDVLRANLRRDRPALTEGRPVEPKTIKLRERLLEQFGYWIAEQGLCLDRILDQGIHAADDLNVLLCRYGRLLYQSGKTYNSFAETINAVATKRPVLRRSLQGAWDLGYAWVKAEPSQHHVAMPAPVLCAMVALAISWGWLPLAGCLALCWGALLRPGELICACRRDLLLPSDLDGTISFALLSIAEPKSRHTTARHQSAKLDAPDLLAFIDFVFKKYEPHQRLWPHAASTLRNRFSQLLRALQLPLVHQPHLRCLDLGSLRSGGATWLMLMTEDADLCRRRGRWASHRMMEIYVQETMALQYMKVISPNSRRIILELFGSFSQFVYKAEELERAKIPLNVWYILFTS